MTTATSSNVAGRALTGGFLIGILTFAVGVIISYIDAYLIGPPNWKFGRQGEFELGVYATFWISVFMVVCYGVSCPIYILLSKRPRPILFGVFIGAFFGFLGATGQLHHLTSMIDFDFGPNSNGLPEIFASAFTSVFITALLSVLLFWTIEFLVHRVFANRKPATYTDNAESGRREILTPAPHTTGHTDP